MQLLCPVPVVHIPSAFKKAQETKGRVAFASGDPDGGGHQWEFFHSLQKGIPLWIFASQTGLSDSNRQYYHGPVFSLHGVFEGFETDETNVENLRPTTTKTDRKTQVYWIAKEFTALPPEQMPKFADFNINGLLRGPKKFG